MPEVSPAGFSLALPSGRLVSYAKRAQHHIEKNPQKHTVQVIAEVTLSYEFELD